MTIQRGPADPERFRVADQWRRRWYVDPLHGDDTWPQWEGQCPAITTLKGAWDKQFSKNVGERMTVKLDAWRAAEYAVDHLDHIRDVKKTDPHQAKVEIARAADHALRRAGNRGTQVHTAAEWAATGQQVDPKMFGDHAPYVTTVVSLVSDLRPEFLYSEVVGIRRHLEPGAEDTAGWGCTIDCILRIDGRTYAVDWKTRGEDSRHGAYDTEAAQIGAAAGVDYLIVGDGSDTGAVRAPLPELDGGLIISIRTDGYEVFPIDVADAQQAAVDMCTGWLLKQSGQQAARRAIGKPLHPSTLRPAAAIEEQLDVQVVSGWLRERIVNLIDNHPAAATDVAGRWPAGVPTLRQGGHTITQVNQIADLLDDIEKDHQIPFGPSRPKVA